MTRKGYSLCHTDEYMGVVIRIMSNGTSFYASIKGDHGEVSTPLLPSLVLAYQWAVEKLNKWME